MIVTIVTFRLPQPTTLAEISNTFQATAPKYRGVPGLLRKNYFMSEDASAREASMCGSHGPMRTASIRRNGRHS
jgi:hypothetical protein